MDGRLTVLHKFLERLGEDLNIDNFADRKRVQKAVYLGQVAGADLGYRYGWYLKGPYSTELTRDYYAMSEALAAGATVPAEQTLKNDVAEKLDKIRPLFDVPDGIDLSKASWLELLASWHYLRTVSKFDFDKARALMEEQKHHLALHINAAVERLAAVDL